MTSTLGLRDRYTAAMQLALFDRLTDSSGPFGALSGHITNPSIRSDTNRMFLFPEMPLNHAEWRFLHGTFGDHNLGLNMHVEHWRIMLYYCDVKHRGGEPSLTCTVQ